MVVAVSDIRAAYWQPELASLGGVVEGVEDIHQCLTIILTTQRGSDPYRPEFAVDLMAYVDRPIQDVRSALVTDIIQAVTRWEKRCQLLKVDAEVEAPSTLKLSVAWRPVEAKNDASQTFQTTAVLSTSSAAAPDAVGQFVRIPFAGTFTLTAVDGGTF